MGCEAGRIHITTPATREIFGQHRDSKGGSMRLEIFKFAGPSSRQNFVSPDRLGTVTNGNLTSQPRQFSGSGTSHVES